MTHYQLNWIYDISDMYWHDLSNNFLLFFVFLQFLVPLPRSEGFEFVMCQWANAECHFTPLIAFQAHGENAPATLILAYFDELSETHARVLGTAEHDERALNATQARFLVAQMKAYYASRSDGGEDEQRRLRLLESFTLTPQAFKHMSLIDELRNMKMNVEQFSEQNEEDSDLTEQKKSEDKQQTDS